MNLFFIKTVKFRQTALAYAPSGGGDSAVT
jgi:hypothetical protein